MSRPRGGHHSIHPPRGSARAVPGTLYVLVDSNTNLRTAQPDGMSALFTDFHRWSTPPPHGRRVQYLFGSRDVARARAKASTGGLLALSAQDLRRDKGPHLLTVDISQPVAIDLHGGPALAAAGLPPAYPDSSTCDTEALRSQCRQAGDSALGSVDAAPSTVVVRPVELGVCMQEEVLLDLDGPNTLTVRRREKWQQWF
jgi:hypothetical protein